MEKYIEEYLEALRIARISLAGEQEVNNVTPEQEKEAYNKIAELQNHLYQLQLVGKRLFTSGDKARGKAHLRACTIR